MTVFGGNPNVTITAINTSGGIASSRTSGQTPCFVQVSASAITATGTSKPYEDLEFVWNFGDTSGTETFSQPIDDTDLVYSPITVNANNQAGPEAVYCYRTAGTYTITLDIRGKNGGAFTTAQTTLNITVSAFNPSAGEYWFDQVSGSDGNAGTSSGSPKQSLSALEALITSNTQFHLKRNSVWVGAAGIDFNNVLSSVDHVRIDAYGTGTDPEISISSGTAPALHIAVGGSSSPRPKTDITISNVKCSNRGTATSSNGVMRISTATNADAILADIYFDNCVFLQSLNTTDGTILLPDGWSTDGLTPRSTNVGLWNCTISSPVNGNSGIYGGAGHWGFIVGLNISGVGSSALLSHHIYPTTQNHGLYRYITFGSGPTRNYCINTNHNKQNPGGGVEYAQYHLISDCDMSGVLRAFDAGNSDNDPSESRFKNFVCQRSAMHDLTGDGVILFPCGESIVVRDCLVWGCDGGGWFTADGPGILAASVYRNKVYRVGNNTVVDYSFGTWTSPAQTITDNVYHDTGSGAEVLDLTSGHHVTAGSVIDRNQYYAPNAPSSGNNFIRNAGSIISFATWQAVPFDTNGSIANPGWSDPASGDFSAAIVEDNRAVVSFVEVETRATGTIHYVEANLSGAGALTADVTVTTTAATNHLITASFAGAGALAANVRVNRQVTAVFVGAGSLNAALRQGQRVTAQLAGAGAVTAALRQGMRVGATFDGLGALSATVTVTSGTVVDAFQPGAFQVDAFQTSAANVNYTVSANFAGAGALAANVLVNRQVAAAFAGAGALTAQLRQGLRVTASFAGVGALTADIRSNKLITANFAGSGELTAALRQGLRVAATFAGAGALTASLKHNLNVQATLTGLGALTAEIQVSGVVADRVVTANFAGAGGLAAALRMQQKVTATFAGAGGLSASLRMRVGVTARFQGAGLLSANLQHLGHARIFQRLDLVFQPSVFAVQYLPIAATFAGTGSLTADIRSNKLITASFQGAGSLNADVRVNKQITAQFAGAGALATALRLGLGVRGTFQGAGLLTADIIVTHPTANDHLITAQFAGAGALSASLRQQMSVTANFGGVGTLSVSLRVNNRVSAQFAGAGAMQEVALRQDMRVRAQFAGLGLLEANILVHLSTSVNHLITARFEGAGGLIANLQIPRASPTGGRFRSPLQADYARPGVRDQQRPDQSDIRRKPNVSPPSSRDRSWRYD